MNGPFSITIDDRELRAGLLRLSRAIQNATPIMQDIGRHLANVTEDSFQSATSPFGEGWPARKSGGDWPLLQKSGGLAASITHGADVQSAWVGASKGYAAIHQFGGLPGMAPGPAAIPPRPYLPVDSDANLAPATRRQVLQIIVKALGEAI